MAQDAYLIRRGKQFYLRLPVPSPIRHLFPSGSGKARSYIVEPIGRNYDPAKLERDRRVADYRALFARAALMTPKAIAAELEAIKDRAKGRATATLPLLESELRHMKGEHEAELEERRRRWEAKRPSDDELWQELRCSVAPKVAKLAKLLDRPIDPGSPAWNALADRVLSDVQEIGRAHV